MVAAGALSALLSCSSADTLTAEADCSVCDAHDFSCAEEPSGRANSTGGVNWTITADGCSASATATTPAIWLHCPASRACVEHEAECYVARFGPRSFSYSFVNGGTKHTLTCTGR